MDARPAQAQAARQSEGAVTCPLEIMTTAQASTNCVPATTQTPSSAVDNKEDMWPGHTLEELTLGNGRFYTMVSRHHGGGGRKGAPHFQGDQDPYDQGSTQSPSIRHSEQSHQRGKTGEQRRSPGCPGSPRARAHAELPFVAHSEPATPRSGRGPRQCPPPSGCLGPPRGDSRADPRRGAAGAQPPQCHPEAETMPGRPGARRPGQYPVRVPSSHWRSGRRPPPRAATPRHPARTCHTRRGPLPGPGPLPPGTPVRPGDLRPAGILARLPDPCPLGGPVWPGTPAAWIPAQSWDPRRTQDPCPALNVARLWDPAVPRTTAWPGTPVAWDPIRPRDLRPAAGPSPSPGTSVCRGIPSREAERSSRQSRGRGNNGAPGRGRLRAASDRLQLRLGLGIRLRAEQRPARGCGWAPTPRRRTHPARAVPSRPLTNGE
nr:proline-rich protein 2 [Camelus dromedarius]